MDAERYQRESELRFALVRVNEYADAISLAAGEPDEVRHIERDLESVLAATWRLVLGLTNLTWITAGYGWVQREGGLVGSPEEMRRVVRGWRDAGADRIIFAPLGRDFPALARKLAEDVLPEFV